MPEKGTHRKGKYHLFVCPFCRIKVTRLKFMGVSHFDVVPNSKLLKPLLRLTINNTPFCLKIKRKLN